MKLATSMWSGQIRHSPPRSRSTPRMRRTFEPIPSISAPSETRKRHRSCTCGSLAALAITVSPSASTAAMTTFSVPVTEASSRKIERAAQALRAHRVATVRVDVRAELRRARECGCRVAGARSRRLPEAARSLRLRGRAEGRRAGWTRGSGCRALRRARASTSRARVDPNLARPDVLDVDAEVGDELEHRLDVPDRRHVREQSRALP